MSYLGKKHNLSAFICPGYYHFLKIIFFNIFRGSNGKKKNFWARFLIFTTLMRKTILCNPITCKIMNIMIANYHFIILNGTYAYTDKTGKKYTKACTDQYVFRKHFTMNYSINSRTPYFPNVNIELLFYQHDSYVTLDSYS